MDVQRTVQLAVLRAIDRNGYAKHSEIGGDSRDIDRAVEPLLRDGAIVMDSSRDMAGTNLPMELTDRGRERLVQE